MKGEKAYSRKYNRLWHNVGCGVGGWGVVGLDLDLDLV